MKTANTPTIVESPLESIGSMKAKPVSGTGKASRKKTLGTQAELSKLSFQLGRILVPIDFSAASKKALHYAASFARAFDAEVILLHVVQPFTVPPEMGYLPPELTGSQAELIKSSRAELEKLSDGALGADGHCEVSVRGGVPWQEVVDAARESDVDLIIVATHGHTGLAHVLLGSVAERVVRHAPCPVLVVRECERDFLPG